MRRSGDHDRFVGASHSPGVSRKNSRDGFDSNRSPRALERQTAIGSNPTLEASADLLVHLIDANNLADLAALCEIANKRGQGGLLNEVDRKGRTPLNRALETRNFGAVRILATYGAKATAQGKYILSMKESCHPGVYFDQLALDGGIPGRAKFYSDYAQSRSEARRLARNVRNQADAFTAFIRDLKAWQEIIAKPNVKLIDCLDQLIALAEEISRQAGEALDKGADETFFCYPPYSSFFGPQLEQLFQLNERLKDIVSGAAGADTLGSVEQECDLLLNCCADLCAHCAASGGQHMARANLPDFIALLCASACSSAGRNAITLCVAQNDHDAFAELKVAYGSDKQAWRCALNAIDGNGSTPLMLACQNDDLPFVCELTLAGADPSVCSAQGVSPLGVAIRRCSLAVIKHLLDLDSASRQRLTL